MRNLISKDNSYDYEVMVHNRWNNRMEMDKKFEMNSGAVKMQTRMDKVWSKKELVSRPVCGKSQPEPNQLGSNLTLPVITESEEYINEGICAASHDKHDEEQFNLLNFIFIDIMEYIWIHSKMITDQLLVMTWPLHYIDANKINLGLFQTVTPENNILFLVMLIAFTLQFLCLLSCVFIVGLKLRQKRHVRGKNHTICSIYNVQFQTAFLCL